MKKLCWFLLSWGFTKKKQVPEKIQKFFLDDDCDNKNFLNVINLIYILFLVFLSLWINISIKMEFMRNASHLNIIDQVEYVISFLFFSFLISALFSSYFFPSLLYSTLLCSTQLYSTLQFSCIDDNVANSHLTI